MFAANTTYSKHDGTQLLTTNADRIVITYPLASDDAGAEGGYNFWLGMSRNRVLEPALNCTNWTSTGAGATCPRALPRFDQAP